MRSQAHALLRAARTTARLVCKGYSGYACGGSLAESSTCAGHFHHFHYRHHHPIQAEIQSRYRSLAHQAILHSRLKLFEQQQHFQRSMSSSSPLYSTTHASKSRNEEITTVLYESDNNRRMVLWARGGAALAASFSLFSLYEITYVPLETDEQYFARMKQVELGLPPVEERPWYSQLSFLTYVCTGFSYFGLSIGYLYSKRYIESISITQDAKMLVSNIRFQTCQFLSSKPRAPIDFPVSQLQQTRSQRGDKTIQYKVKGYRLHFLVERNQIMHDPDMLFAMSQGGKHVDALSRTRFGSVQAHGRGSRSTKSQKINGVPI